MLREELVAERVVIETILAKEEEHAAELTNILFAVDPATGHKPEELYFGDKIPDNSQAGDGIRSAWRRRRMCRVQWKGTASPWIAGHACDRL